MEERMDEYSISVRRPEGKRQVGRLRCRWEGNIKMDFQEVGYGHGLDWSASGEEQLAGCCTRDNEPPGSIKCRGFLD